MHSNRADFLPLGLLLLGLFGLLDLVGPGCSTPPEGLQTNAETEEIGIECTSLSLHIAPVNQPNRVGKVKILMGKQSNKVEKRRRRDSYLKRRKVKAKAKKA